MEKINKKIEIDNMITLCHIVDEFEKKLISAISPKEEENGQKLICVRNLKEEKICL